MKKPDKKKPAKTSRKKLQLKRAPISEMSEKDLSGAVGGLSYYGGSSSVTNTAETVACSGDTLL